MDPNILADILFDYNNLDSFRESSTFTEHINLINYIKNLKTYPELTPDRIARLDAWKSLLEININKKWHGPHVSAAAAGRRRK
jgi:hypothetical protein